jgi:hypothetical protein
VSRQDGKAETRSSNSVVNSKSRTGSRKPQIAGVDGKKEKAPESSIEGILRSSAQVPRRLAVKKVKADGCPTLLLLS